MILLYVPWELEDREQALGVFLLLSRGRPAQAMRYRTMRLLFALLPVGHCSYSDSLILLQQRYYQCAGGHLRPNAMNSCLGFNSLLLGKPGLPLVDLTVVGIFSALLGSVHV